ncbi:phosphodiesterase [Thaumasiovibrio sp. DFM-14]|uniref:phosphodiesterase n=1 Tax=Thaumasiovibrio sp. DFM-14 TaxID=3384792 RepID=UPI00399F011E
MLIAQVTDIHIQPHASLLKGRIDTYQKLKNTINHLNRFHPVIDLVVITGDLVETGTREEYELLNTQLDNLAIPYFVVPGNHDDHDFLRRSLRSSVGYTHTGPLHFQTQQQGLNLIGLDTSDQNSPKAEFGAEKQAWFRRALEDSTTMDTMIFMHHPPYLTGIKHMDDMGFPSADEEFWSIAKNYPNIMHVASGHIHRAIDSTCHGVPVSTGPSCCHSVKLDLCKEMEPCFTLEPPAIRLFKYNDGQLNSFLSYILPSENILFK